MISITIPVVHGKELSSVLASVFSSTFQDFEVIVNDASPPDRRGVIRQVLSTYDVKILRSPFKTLESRFRMALLTSGTHILMLDETRRVHPELLSHLTFRDVDVAFIGEEEVGGRPWLRWIRADFRRTLEVGSSGLAPSRQLYCLPRYYRREILLSAFAAARERLGADRFGRVITADLEIPFIESYDQTTQRQQLSTAFIFHLGEEDLLAYLRKYVRYGVGARLLRGTPYEKVASPKMHQRSLKGLPLKTQVQILLSLGVRATCFAAGYYFSQDS